MIQLMVGPMGSGKSAKLIDSVELLEEENRESVCFKPKIDTRSHFIESRNGKRINAFKISTFSQILDVIKLNNSSITVIIDEIQFISTEGIFNFIKYVKENDIQVIACGLNLTSECTPFESTANFAMYADYVEYITGKCDCCGELSYLTKCTVEKTQEVLVGNDIYMQTCYKCY